jgi:hypothetical protein
VFASEVPEKAPIHWNLRKIPETPEVKRVSPLQWLARCRYGAPQSVLDEFARDASFNQYASEIALAPQGAHLDHNFSAFFPVASTQVCSPPDFCGVENHSDEWSRRRGLGWF